MPNETVPTEVIEKDIADTLAEIATMEREIEGFRLLGDRWSQMRADARVTGIRERKEFIGKLQSLLAKRSVAAPASTEREP